MSFSTTIDALLQDLLARTSRTFALAIPLLPFPAQREVTIAYLLFRVADTIEDGRHFSRRHKLHVLDTYGEILQHPATRAGVRKKNILDLPSPPCDNQDYLDLLGNLPAVLESASTLRPNVHAAIRSSLQKSITGMKRFIAAGSLDGSVRLETLDELREYCYCVAGLVGELLTEIFVSGATWPEDVRLGLDAGARWFGEGLQLVNILKDSDEDESDGRRFIPRNVPRAKLFELAREDLCKAQSYVDLLRRAEAPAGFLAFTELPLQLAWRTLDRVEESGPGSKVPRDEVLAILAETIPNGVIPRAAATASSKY